MKKLQLLLITSLLFSSCDYVYRFIEPVIGDVLGHTNETVAAEKVQVEEIVEDSVVYGGIAEAVDASGEAPSTEVIMCEYCPSFPAEYGSNMCNGCISEEDEMEGMGPDMRDMGSPDNSWDLHHSLTEYETNIFESETDNFRIRVDLLGYNNRYEKEYRYASWTINESHNYEPALILHSTEVILTSNGKTYGFQNGLYRYMCSVIDKHPRELIVYKGEQELRRAFFK